MRSVNNLVVLYSDLAESHDFSREVVTLEDKTCQEISTILKANPMECKTYKEISNILEGEKLKTLRDFLFFLSKYGALEQSQNIGNKFEEEKEIKILNIDYHDLIDRLEFMNAIQVFDGIIDDVYLDLPGKILEDNNLLENGFKVSFRIRYKLSKDGHFSLYYTIKRKKPKDKNLKIPTRICYEKEFQIKSPGMVIDGLELINLKPYRRKIKQRIAYVLGGVKFDIDLYEQINGYNKIPPLLEIETDNLDSLPLFLLALGLKDNEISDSGSRGLHEKVYGIPKDAHMIKDLESGLIVPEWVLEQRNQREKEKQLKN